MFETYCSECGELLKEGESVAGASVGTIAPDGGFYPNDDEYLWVRHSPECTDGEPITSQ